MIRRIIKSVRLRGHIHKDILLTPPLRRNRYGIKKWGISLNTGILFGALSLSSWVDFRTVHDSGSVGYEMGRWVGLEGKTGGG